MSNSRAAGRQPDWADEQTETHSPPGLDLGRLARQHKWLLLAGALAGLAFGELAYRKLGPSYLATTRILVSKRTSVPLRAENDPRAYGDRGEHIALIMSPMIVEAALERHGLAELASLRGEQDPVQEILATLKARRTAGSDQSALNVVELSFESAVPGDSARVVSAVAGAYGDYLKNAHNRYIKEMIALATDGSQRLLAELQAKEAEYLKFHKEAPLEWRGKPAIEGAAAAPGAQQDRADFIEARRRSILTRRAEIESRLEALSAARGEGQPAELLEAAVQRFMLIDRGSAPAGAALPAAAQPAAQAAFEARLLPLILEEVRLLRTFGDDHPEVRAVRENISSLRGFYAAQGIRLPDFAPSAGEQHDGQPAPPLPLDAVTAYEASLRLELEDLALEDQRLAEAFATEARVARELSQFQLEDATRSAEIRRLRTLTDQLTTRLSELSALPDSGGYDLQVVAPPREELSIKRWLKFDAGGLALGLAAALGAVYLRARRDTVVATVTELRNLLDLPILGRVPLVPAEATARVRPPFDRWLLYVQQPESLAAEAYRKLRVALQVATQSRGQKVLAVSSALPNDGKTMVVANLGAALAHARKRVLLIDADLRRPRLSGMFGQPPEVGLADVLGGDLDAASATQETPLSGLHLLAAGQPPENPAELLSSEQFARLVRMARQEYDYVLLDGPPILAVSDAATIALAADGLVLVARLNKNRREEFERVREHLAASNVGLVGAVANAVIDTAASGCEDYYTGYGARSAGAAAREAAPPEAVLAGRA